MYGLKDSLIGGITRATGLQLRNKNVVFVGFSEMVKGIALQFKDEQCHTYLAESDPTAAAQAGIEGFSLIPLNDALGMADVVLTTGDHTEITVDDLTTLKDGCLYGNIGSSSQINMAELRKQTARKIIKPLVETYTFSDGRKITVLD